MKIGFMGMGKLGFPIAMTIAANGHQVKAYDPNKRIRTYLEQRGTSEGAGAPPPFAHREEGMGSTLARARVEWVPPWQLVQWADLIFVAVQTPHEEKLGGDRMTNAHRADFDYTFLTNALERLDEAASAIHKRVPVAVISTCLPGTMDRLVPLFESLDLAYNPSFVAMGTVIPDYLNPEFILIGGSEESPTAALLRGFYAGFPWPNGAPPVTRKLSFGEAELVKMAYNTFITQKIVFANALGELCEGLGLHVGAVTSTLGLAKRRLWTNSYFESGMGDGGACHPRDNVAMAWLGRELNLSYNPFETMVQAREQQARRLADIVQSSTVQQGVRLKVVILGTSYKANSALKDGSPALLVADLLEKRGVQFQAWDPLDVEQSWALPSLLANPAVFLIGVGHRNFRDIAFPNGSVVIDPIGILNPANHRNVTLERLGRPWPAKSHPMEVNEDA